MTAEAASAIISFLRSFNLGGSELQLASLSNGEVLAELLLLADGFHLENDKIQRQNDNWTAALNNIKLLLRCLTDFYERVLRKELPVNEIQPIEIGKNRNQQQIVQLFGLVLGALTQSNNKELFIEKILSLSTEHQAYFAEVIRRAISTSEQEEDSNSERKLLEQLGSLEEENSQLRMELTKVVEQQSILQQALDDAVSKLDAARAQIQTLRNGRGSSTLIEAPPSVAEEHAVAEQWKRLGVKLKQKMLQMSLDHERELIKYKEEMEVMEARLLKVSELEAMADMYRENYEEALEHLSRVNVWEKEKQRMSLQIEEYVQLVSEKTETVSDLNEKIYKLEQELLERQMEYERLSLRHNELEGQVRRTLNIEPKEKTRVGRHTLTELCPQISEDSTKFKLEEAQREVERKNKRLKDMERDISKYKAKADRVYQLEKEKTKLENIIVDFSQSKSEEIELLVSALYELRLKYGTMVEEFGQQHNSVRGVIHAKTHIAA